MYSFHYTKKAIKYYNQDNDESLQISALYLRLATESRQMEYVNARDELIKKKLKSNKLRPISKELENYFNNNMKIIELDTGNNKWYYTPVTKKQIKLCEKLGGWLHFNEKFTNPTYFTELKEHLKQLITYSVIANCGDLIGVPHYKEKNGKIDINIPFRITDEEVEYYNKHPKKKTEYKSLHPSNFIFNQLDYLPEEYFLKKLKMNYDVKSIAEIIKS